VLAAIVSILLTDLRHESTLQEKRTFVLTTASAGRRLETNKRMIIRF
jgi:hypothetical protein